MKQELYRWVYQMDLFRENFSDADAQKAAMLNAVKYYKNIHSSEIHLVGPINLHEIFIDPKNGDFEMKAGEIDKSLFGDIDSIKFMPPEVLNTKSEWDISADNFVLAQLLFVLRYCKHPYDGKQVLKTPVTDVNKARQLYGSCRFIFDAENSENALDSYADSEPVENWERDENLKLKDAFLRVFTFGFSDVSMRLCDDEWENIIE